MSYKLYVLSSKDSQLPYEINGLINDKSKSIFWKFIGEVDDLYVAREMMLHDKVYLKKNNKEYWLKHEPCNDMKYQFGKIEYNNNIEYYDVYHKSTNSIFERRY